MFSFSSFLLQPFSSWLPFWPLPSLFSLLSEPCAQYNITSLFLPVEAEAAAAAHVSTAFLAIAFQALQCCFMKCWRGQGKT